MPAVKDYTVFAIASTQLRTLSADLKRNNVNSFLSLKDFDFYTTEEKAMEAIIAAQNKAWKDAPNLGVRAIKAEGDTLGMFKTYPAPVFFMQPMALAASDWRDGVKNTIGRNDGLMGRYSSTHGMPVGLPTVFIGRDDSAEVKVIVPDTKSANKFTTTIIEAANDRLDQLQALVEAQYGEFVAANQARAQQTQSHAQAERDTDVEADPGKALIVHWMAQLKQIQGYEEFSTQLGTEYQKLASKNPDSRDTSMEAYTVMERVFSNVQIAASRKNDYQTATAAQGIVRMYGAALDDLRRGDGDLRDNQSNGYMSREEAAGLGIYIPEDKEEYAYE